jgi:hypothetical protein
MKDVLVLLVGGLTIAVASIVIVLLLGFPVMWLWNWLMPSIFGLKALTLWEAIGLSALCSILFQSSASSRN